MHFPAVASAWSDGPAEALATPMTPLPADPLPAITMAPLDLEGAFISWQEAPWTSLAVAMQVVCRVVPEVACLTAPVAPAAAGCPCELAGDARFLAALARCNDRDPWLLAI